MRGVPRIHIILFAITFFFMLAAGVLQGRTEFLDEPVGLVRELITRPWILVEGLPFAVTLMLILLSHEMSHYFASRAHHTEATLPYFIPAPSIIGTFGAFIKMKSPIINRKALVDIGASGPIAGFVVSVAASAIGLAGSEYLRVEPQEIGPNVVFGINLLFYWLSILILGMPPEGNGFLISLHPVAVAGWLGFFLTSLNLLPVGQLDGGHITYALLGKMHRRISITLVTVLAVLGLILWPGWAILAVLMLILGVTHPPVVYWESPLDPMRKLVGWAALIIFLLTFTPVPISSFI